MAPDFRDLANSGARQMALQNLHGLEAEPGIDDGSGAIGKIIDEGKDRLVARFAEQPVVVAVAGAEMREERFLDGIER